MQSVSCFDTMQVISDVGLTNLCGNGFPAFDSAC